MIYTAYYNSPIGKISLASKDNALVGLWIEGQKHFLKTLEEETIANDKDEILIKSKQWLDRYFNGGKPKINGLKLELTGSEFAKSVWNILIKIPYGETITYGEIAEKIALERGIKNMSAQAVGGAVGRNPISIIIPCHRVVGANGNLTGYAGGIDKKIKLLENEGIDITKYKIPK